MIDSARDTIHSLNGLLLIFSLVKYDNKDDGKFCKQRKRSILKKVNKKVTCGKEK